MNIVIGRFLNRNTTGGLLIAACLSSTHPGLYAAERNVNIQHHAFSPATIEIDVGDTVIWTQLDFDGHTTTSDTGVWSSPLLFVGQTFPHTFTQAGNYPYHCVPHPDMRGTVIVRPPVIDEISVQLVQPAPGTVLTVPGTVRLEAVVDPSDTEILHVEFLNGETSLGLIPKEPYVLLVNLGEGQHSITAVAHDAEGTDTASDPVGVEVIQPAPVVAQPTTHSIPEGMVTIAWTDGTGPFLVQQSPNITKPDWELQAASIGRTLVTHPHLGAAFFRIIDTAGHPGIPFTASLTGAAERPNPVETDASGSGLFRLKGNILTFNIRYEGLSGPATAAHIHGPAPAAAAADVLIDLAPFNGDGFGMEGVLSGQVILSPEHKVMLLEGRTYVNVHTQQNPPGEIRGQIAPVVHQIKLTGAKERPDPVETPGHGFGTLLLVGNQLSFHIDYTGLTEPATAAHIHGPAGADTPAGVLVGLEDHAPAGFGSAGTLVGSVTLTPDQLAWLLDRQTYINIHTPTHPPGEIRGQIIPQVIGTPLTTAMSGDAERPDPVDTDAVGTGLFRLEDNLLIFNIRYEGLSGSATAAHIHGPASADAPAGILIDLAPYNGTGFGSAGILSGSVRLTAEQRGHLLAGRTYVNVHTQQHPPGEIRGQIVPLLHQITLNGASERPDPVASSGSGFGTLLLVGPELTFHLDYRDLSGPATAAHIHGPASTEVAGDILVDLGPHAQGGFGDAGTLRGQVSLNPNQLGWLIDARTYINIHTQLRPPGEIRGQIER
jgi:plastocyanin